MRKRILNLKCSGNWWRFAIYDRINHRYNLYMTNKLGKGLFEYYDFHNQYIGTCDFSLRGKSYNAAYCYIRRFVVKGVIK